MVAQMPRTLIADDQPDVRAALRLLLKGAGYQTEAADSPAAVLDAIKQQKFDLVLMDLNYARDTTSGKEGLDLISRIQALDHDLPIVVMTAWATVDLAVESMRLGVRDFVQKPWENSGLLRKLRTQIEQGRARRVEQSREQQLKIELNEAREIQRGLMPRKMPNLAGFSLALPGERDSLWCFDLAVPAADPMVFALGGTHAKPIAAADAEIDLTMGERKFVRSPPIGQMLGFGPDLEDQVARRVIDAG